MTTNRFRSNLRQAWSIAAALALLVHIGSAPAHAQPAPAPAPEPPAPDVPATAAPPLPVAPEDAAPVTDNLPPANAPDPVGAQAAPLQSVQSAESDAEAAALEAELASQSASSDVGDFKLNFYGFADFTFTQPIGEFALLASESTFAVGKLNLYAAADLGDDWRSLSEIRFSYLPNGSTSLTETGALTRTDTSVGDPTDLSRPVRWGGIIIERAWLEHTFHPALTVRAGQWLTPYGIWNVDHGSPVIIGVRKPFIVGEGLLPERQTGLEIYGAWGFGASQLGYHVTLSNGRGPVDTYRDLDNNKGLGARLFWKQETGVGALTVGTSGYRGKYTDSQSQYGLGPAGELTLSQSVTSRYDELSLALDAKWEWGGWLVQSEAVLNDVAYSDPYRATELALTGGPPGYAPDHRRFGAYGIAGYRTSFLGLMPFGGGEYYDPGLRTYTSPAIGLWGGLNCRPTPRVVLKAQYSHAFFPEDSSQGSLDIVELQAAWSF